MKKEVIIGLFAVALIIGGCAKKSVEVQAPPAPVEKETVKSEPTPTPTTTVREGEGIAEVKSKEIEKGLNEQDMKLKKMTEIEKEAKIIYFDFDRYNIRNDQVERVDYDAELFNEEEAKEFKIKIEGNCDEWGTDEYNYALGLKRAKSVRDALIQRGVAKNRMILVSYGESNPVCFEHNIACWRKNRRAEFKLLP
jgi:peptidoglycan-associated lipoprotein